jgi:hypothetical protein
LEELIMRGPLYGVELLETLRLNLLRPHPEGIRQQMPSTDDLREILQDHCRVVAGFEVLTQYLGELRKLFDKFQTTQSPEDLAEIARVFEGIDT